MRSPTPALLALLLAACSPAPLSPARPALAPTPLVAAPPTPIPPLAPSCARASASPPITALDPPSAGATVALARAASRTVAYVADEDERALRTVDVDSGVELAITPLGAAPGQILITADGRVVVALRGASALAVLEPAGSPDAPLELRCTVEAPTEPVGLAVTPDGARLVAASRWGRALTVYEAASMKRVREVALPRDPAAVVISGDGRKAFVSHVVGTRLSVVDLDGDAERPAGAARVIDLHQVERAATPATPWSVVQGYTLVRAASGRIFAPEVLTNTRPPGEVVSSGYGSGGTPTQIGDIAVLDEAGERLATTPVLPFINHVDCLLPRAAALDEASGRLLVACLGVNRVIAYDARKPNPHLYPLRQWSVASGPTGIALDAARRRAVVWSQFARTLSTVAVDGPPVNQAPGVVLARHAAAADPRLELGRKLFHASGDPRLAGDMRACASCHPDGRDDALTWSTPDGPRQTPILAKRLADTAPYSWDGANRDLEGHVRRTFQRLFGVGLSATDQGALLAYIESMDMPAPRAVRSAAAARGEALFNSTETACATCHRDARSADGASHDVVSRVKGDRTAAFDTPSLRFLGQSAPYFHDGRYATLLDLLRGVDGTMGHTAHLSPANLGSLEAYLESL